MTPRKRLTPRLDTSERLTEVKLGRNYIRQGDYCWVKADKPGKQGFPARFQYAEEQPSGRIVATVHELEGGRYRAIRCVTLDRIQRKVKDRYR